MIRTTADPFSLLPAIEKIIWRLDPDLAISDAKTMEHIIQSATLERRFESDLLLGFSGSALFLSALGLFGVASLIALFPRRWRFRVSLNVYAAAVAVLTISAMRAARNGPAIVLRTE